MEGPLRPDGLTLIETFARRAGRFVRLDAHLARMQGAAGALGFPWNRSVVEEHLVSVEGDDPLRVRLTLNAAGRVAVTAAPLPAGPATWRLAIHGERLDPSDPWLRIKSSERRRYDAARAALPPWLDEWLFLNTPGELCEGTITNLFLRRGGDLLTPPLACGLLPGVLRAELLAQGAREAVLTPEDLATGEIFVGNSLRGLLPARMVEAESCG